MSTPELDKYKKTYSEFVEEIVYLHNAHLTYTKKLGRETGFAVRKHIKKIIKLQKELHKTSVAAFVEHRANNKIRREMSIKHRDIVKKIMQEKKAKTNLENKNGNDNKSTTDPI
jgi:hypothetical protein